MTKLTQSYVHGVSMTPLIGETIGVHFDKAAARWGERDALIVRQQNVRWTYRELQTKVDALAAGLLALGLAPGDRIGIWSPNNAEWVITQFATAKAGLILVNINPAYRLSELDYALNKVGCKALITADIVQDQRLCRHAARTRAGDRPQRPRQIAGQTPAGADDAHSYRRRREARLPALCRRARHGRRAPSRASSPSLPARCNSTIRSTSSSPAAPPARRRARRSRTTTSSTTATSSARRSG